MSLYGISKNGTCTIATLPPVGLLKSLGLREGLQVMIRSKQPMGGPVIVQVGRRCVAIAEDIAKEIHVEEDN